jgi:hypothetical protein
MYLSLIVDNRHDGESIIARADRRLEIGDRQLPEKKISLRFRALAGGLGVAGDFFC